VSVSDQQKSLISLGVEAIISVLVLSRRVDFGLGLILLVYEFGLVPGAYRQAEVIGVSEHPLR